MSLLDAFLQTSVGQQIEQRLTQLLSAALAPIKPIIAIVTKFRDNTAGIFDAAAQLIQKVETEYEAIKNFQEKPQWKNRVISVPQVIKHINDLAQVPAQVAGSIKDLVATLKAKLDPGAFNVDELENIEDLRGLLTKFGSRFAAIFEKILGWLALIVDALVAIRSTIDDLSVIVDAVTTVRENLDNLDLVFLPQKNPRKVEKLAAGGSIKIRVGSLHSV